MKLQFVDDIGELYEFWFEYPVENDPYHYVGIQRYFQNGGWSKFYKVVNSQTLGIDWGDDMDVSKDARHYIEKVAKNKAFI